MEQFEDIVLKAPPEGMHYVMDEGENGEPIVRLVPKPEFFTKITAEDREKVKKWVVKQSGKTFKEIVFLVRVKEAVQNVNYDYWIANLEPSVKNGKIYYAENQDVGAKFFYYQWKQMAREYKPERGSRLCNLHELFIWYALRIVNNLWTLGYVANGSSSEGNYCKAPDSSKAMDKTGVKECGGYKDGQGNTYKIVTDDGKCVLKCALVGGHDNFVGYHFPVADVYYQNGWTNNILYGGSGVLVLTK